MIDEIKKFVAKLLVWSSENGKRLAELDDQGMVSSKESEDILSKAKDVMELIDALYASDNLVDENGNSRINYLTDTDEDIRTLIQDWSHYLKLEMLPFSGLPLERVSYYVRQENTGGTIGTGLPSGGGPNYILGQDSSGNPIWILKPTLFELDETV